MQFSEISRFLSRYLFYFTLILCVPLAVAIGYEFFSSSHPQRRSSMAFAQTIGVCLLLSLLFYYFGRRASGNFQRRESILIVALVWFLTPLISSLPFLFSHTLQSPVDAYFEAMSGLTTTGSTVLHPKAYDAAGNEVLIANGAYHFFGTVAPVGAMTGVEALGKGLLFWRSFLQWIGGMGIVVLFITILPALSMGGRLLFEAEVPGPTKESMTPRVKETAGLLWRIYLALTAVQVVLLMVFNPSLPFFDALTLTFSTLSTGGFSVRNEGIAAYHSLSLEWIVLIFMVLGSVNFTLYFHILKRKIYRIYEPEFFSFLATLILGSVLMSLLLYGAGLSLGQAFHLGTFQAVSSQTSTGFAIADYDLWPFATQALLLILMFVGGMSGSTAGGIKIIRHLILFRVVRHKIESIFRPSAVRCLKIGSREVTEKTAANVLIFFTLLIFLTVLGVFLLVIDGVDPQTSLGVISSMVNNNGLTFQAAGPTQSCAFLPDFSKIVSIIWMALGRLELFILLVLLVPAFWRNR